MNARYRVIVPVQTASRAMPRSGLAPNVRARLSQAFAIDTLDVLRRCGSVAQVVVVSPDPATSALASAAGATFIQSDPEAGLNAAVDDAHRQTLRTGDQMVAALVSDLPALGRDDLERVLSSAGRRHRTMYVTDLGHNHVTLQVERASTFVSCLAPDRARHVPRGEPMRALVPGLRADVDTSAGLRIAGYMGVGSATLRAMDDLAPEILVQSEAI